MKLPTGILLTLTIATPIQAGTLVYDAPYSSVTVSQPEPCITNCLFPRHASPSEGSVRLEYEYEGRIPRNASFSLTSFFTQEVEATGDVSGVEFTALSIEDDLDLTNTFVGGRPFASVDLITGDDGAITGWDIFIDYQLADPDLDYVITGSDGEGARSSFDNVYQASFRDSSYSINLQLYSTEAFAQQGTWTNVPAVPVPAGGILFLATVPLGVVCAMRKKKAAPTTA